MYTYMSYVKQLFPVFDNLEKDSKCSPADLDMSHVNGTRPKSLNFGTDWSTR